MNSLINNNVTLGGAQTISGMKTISNDGESLSYQEKIICKNLDFNNLPESDAWGGIEFDDVNETRISKIEPSVTPDGTSRMNLSASRLVNNVMKYAIVSVGVSQDGTAFTEAPASDKANSIVTTQSFNASLYCIFGNGLKIQWNNKTGAASGTITFSTPFSGTVYKVATSVNDANEPRVIVCNTFTTTGFNFTCYRQNGSGTITAATPFSWIAIGV